MKLSALIFALCLALAIAAGCGGDGGSDSSSSSSESSAPAKSTGSTESAGSTEPPTTTEKAKPPTTEKAKPPTTDKTKPKVTVPKGIDPKKFATRDLEVGTGPSVKTGDEVTIHYVGVGYDSKREIESTWSEEPYTFTVGGGEALKGGERGVQGMKVGGRREMIIPGNLAYGPEGRPPTIGPNETLIFVIDVLAIK